MQQNYLGLTVAMQRAVKDAALPCELARQVSAEQFRPTKGNDDKKRSLPTARHLEKNI